LKYIAHQQGWFAKGAGPSPPNPTADIVSGFASK
jgi:hypothetical protein